MLQAVEAVINPDGTVHLLEELQVTKPTRVVMTILPGGIDEAEEPTTIWTTGKGSVADTLALLSTPAHRSRPAGNAQIIEQTIQENRDAWDYE